MGEAETEKGPVDLFPAERHNKEVVAGAYITSDATARMPCVFLMY